MSFGFTRTGPHKLGTEDRLVTILAKTRRPSIWDVPEPYFYNDAAYCHVENMTSPVNFGLTVAPIHETSTMCKVCSDVLGVLLNQTFVLDVDLDVFSTQNPFQNKFTDEQLELIDQLYAPPPGIVVPLTAAEFEDAAVVLAHANASAKVLNGARRRQLSRLRQWLQCWSRGVTPSNESILLWPEELACLGNLVLSLDDLAANSRIRHAVEETLKLVSARLADGSELPPVTLCSEDQCVQEALAKLNVSDVDMLRTSHRVGDQTDGVPISCHSPNLTPAKRRPSSPITLRPETPNKLRLRSDNVASNDRPIQVDSGGDSIDSTSESDRNMKLVLTKVDGGGLMDVTESTTHNDSELHASGVDTMTSPSCDRQKPTPCESSDPLLFMHYLWSGVADQENDPLPHHVSTEEEQRELRDHMEGMLNRLHNPCLITIARSELDNYTPRHQVASLQLELLQAFNRVYGPQLISVTLDYENSEADAETLRNLGFYILTPDELYANGRKQQQHQPSSAHSETPVRSTSDEPGRKDIV